MTRREPDATGHDAAGTNTVLLTVASSYTLDQ